MPKEIGKLPKGDIYTVPERPATTSGVPTVAGPAGPTPKGVVVGTEPTKHTSGSDKKPH